jgi:hypothetical protein
MSRLARAHDRGGFSLITPENPPRSRDQVRLRRGHHSTWPENSKNRDKSGNMRRRANFWSVPDHDRGGFHANMTQNPPRSWNGRAAEAGGRAAEAGGRAAEAGGRAVGAEGAESRVTEAEI